MSLQFVRVVLLHPYTDEPLEEFYVQANPQDLRRVIEERYDSSETLSDLEITHSGKVP